MTHMAVAFCVSRVTQVLSEGLRATHQRMVKHVTREGQLLGPLWDKLSDTLFAMFSRCERVRRRLVETRRSKALVCVVSGR